MSAAQACIKGVHQSETEFDMTHKKNSEYKKITCLHNSIEHLHEL